MENKKTLEEQIKIILSDPAKHGDLVDTMMEIVKKGGGSDLKKTIKKWIEAIKQGEGLS